MGENFCVLSSDLKIVIPLVVASLHWGLKKGRQSVESGGCHGTSQNPSCSAFPALPSLRRASARPLLSQHLPDARRAASLVAVLPLREGPIGAQRHGLLQLEDCRAGGRALTGCDAAGRHADLDGPDPPPSEGDAPAAAQAGGSSPPRPRP